MVVVKLRFFMAWSPFVFCALTLYNRRGGGNSSVLCKVFSMRQVLPLVVERPHAQIDRGSGHRARGIGSHEGRHIGHFGE